MRRLTPAVLVALAATAIVTAALAARAPAAGPLSQRTTILTRGEVGALALDGTLLAYDVRAAPAGCNAVHVRDLRSGADTIVSARRTCAADSTSTGAGVRELALAGRRAAWIVNLGGNTESTDTLYTATVGGQREHRVAAAVRRGDVDGALRGGWLGHLVGAGGTFALNRWQTGASGSVVGSSLRTVTRGLRMVLSGPASLAVAAAAANRIAILQQDGTIALRDGDGELLAEMVPTAAAREVALTRSRIVALEPGRLGVARASDGGRVGEIRVPAGARSLDAHDGLAAFAVGRSVYAADLATGSVGLVATAPKAVGTVQIDAGGLVYAFDRVTGVAGKGVIVVTPLAGVRAALR